ncbi:hypothetical protein GWK08_11795 [Leptobacterium flavescens]|uniref:DUF1905 domain-containing protein n=1 Tax=Leptobacterium flavescens TaxID=472055 RepID=A0A6P0UM78_9FLAO|nr:YdeI/OmpD-associated family protein [Leptobacterium flavescens]NER14127.1 hypothetical protein [Leptobacterium flavescens]
MAKTEKLLSPEFTVFVHGMHAVLIPDKIVDPVLEAGHDRVKVRADFEGKSIEFHAALRKHNDQVRITFSKAKQKELGLFPNDEFRMQFFEDGSRYGVDMPEELEAVLQSDEGAFGIFEGFTAGKQRSIIYMISRYRNSQTRIDKSLLLCENLKRGISDKKDLLKNF